jgi:hypothetical protein
MAKITREEVAALRKCRIQMEVFVQAVESGRLSAAARRVRMTPSAVSGLIGLSSPEMSFGVIDHALDVSVPSAAKAMANLLVFIEGFLIKPVHR